MKLWSLEMVLIINMIDLRSKLKSSGENVTQVLTVTKKMKSVVLRNPQPWLGRVWMDARSQSPECSWVLSRRSWDLLQQETPWPVFMSSVSTQRLWECTQSSRRESLGCFRQWTGTHCDLSASGDVGIFMRVKPSRGQCWTKGCCYVTLLSSSEGCEVVCELWQGVLRHTNSRHKSEQTLSFSSSLVRSCDRWDEVLTQWLSLGSI